ncbi:MAG: hypothetical protein ACREQX_01310 [Candidatus Binataceae bacterium]
MAEHIWCAVNCVMGWDLVRVWTLSLIGAVLLMALSRAYPQLPLSTIDPAIMPGAVALIVAHGFWELRKM